MATKKEFMAIQSIWYACVLRYISTSPDNLNERTKIIDDFRDTLIDIKPNDDIDKETGKKNYKNLRRRYDEWEANEWLPDCIEELHRNVKQDPFFYGDEDSKEKRLDTIKHQNNYKRLRKIMEIIQQSGIGLGTAKERGHYELSGFMGSESD